VPAKAIPLTAVGGEQEQLEKLQNGSQPPSQKKKGKVTLWQLLYQNAAGDVKREGPNTENRGDYWLLCKRDFLRAAEYAPKWRDEAKGKLTRAEKNRTRGNSEGSHNEQSSQIAGD